MSIVAVVVAALTLPPVGVAAGPQGSAAGWKTAVSPQYHGRYRDADDALTSATSPAHRSTVEPAQGKASSVAASGLSPSGVVGGRGVYGAIYRDDAISPRQNFTVSRASHSNVTADAFGAPISARTDGYIGAPISASSCVAGPAESRHCAPELGSGTTIGGELERSRLMLRIGGALGLAYVAFLILWFWATRMRPGPARSARV
jgi:hypothetical protein